MKKFFPLTDVAMKSLMHLVVVVLAYCVAAWLIGVVAGLFNILPIIRLVTGIIAWALRVYCAVGAVYAILKWFKLV